jgi:SHAQKYF class myb-like DNA-binding protein
MSRGDTVSSAEIALASVKTLNTEALINLSVPRPNLPVLHSTRLISSVPCAILSGHRSPGSPKSRTRVAPAPFLEMTTASSTLAGDRGAQGENTGRWTAEEHRLFLQGLEQHGKGWKKIASLIKSRTVVQIRTHAQKYFQKLAKARQNGEEGDVIMEGRGGDSSVASETTNVAAQTNKRRRQVSGTKRKAIQSVVSSAIRQGKKMAAAQAAAGIAEPVAPLPAVAPTLAHFLLPNVCLSMKSSVPSIAESQGLVSGPALEDSMYVFVLFLLVKRSRPHRLTFSYPQFSLFDARSHLERDVAS